LGPNSPREIGVGDVMPREIKPDIASKSNVKQTICLATLAPKFESLHNATADKRGLTPIR